MKVAADLSQNYIEFYELRVEAFDLGTPSRSSIAKVMVSVIDENTQRPVFTQTQYSLSVREGK